MRPEESKDSPPVPSTAEGLSHPSSTSATIRPLSQRDQVPLFINSYYGLSIIH